MTPRVAILIPALNEEKSLPRVLDTWKSHHPDYPVVVVDNGSTDQTALLASLHGAAVIIEARAGYGRACLAGLAYLKAEKNPPDIVIITDADGADDINDAVKLIAPIAQDEADLVIGSRTLGQADPGALTPQAEFGNNLAIALMSSPTRPNITDLGPFRAIHFQKLMGLNMVDETWGWNVEMYLKACRHGLRILEVPVHYQRRQAGQSKISGNVIGAMRAGFKILWAVMRYR